MDNNLNPFAPKQNRNPAYNRIKRNRAFRSEKKFSEGQEIEGMRGHRSSLRTQLRALIEEAPCDESILIGYIDELRQKLQQIKASPLKKQDLPLQQNLFSRKHSISSSQKPRYKTNIEQSTRKTTSKSLNLLSHKNAVDPSGLMNLQEMRNQIKKRKQYVNEKRLATEKQNYRYQNLSEQKRRQRTSQNIRKPTYQDIKLRSVTQEVIKSQRNPARIYHHYSPRKIGGSINNKQSLSLIKANSTMLKRQPESYDEMLRPSLKKQTKKSPETQKENIIFDNNQKIGDLSTIIKQKQTLNFLGDSCVGIKQELSPRKPLDPHTSKILQFVGWRTNQLKNIFSGSKQKKRKTGMDKLSKIFPKGFFT